MRLNFKINILLTVISVVFMGCQPKEQNDCGFVQNVYGQRITWKTKEPIEFVITSDVPQQLRSAIYRAAAKWEQRIGKKLFAITEDATKASGYPKKDGKNAIYFLPNWEKDKHSEQGRTSVYWAADQIMEADIRINGYDFSYYNEDSKDLIKGLGIVNSFSSNVGYSFEALVLHELGHFLGLKHTDAQGSVMVTHLAANSDRTEPSSKDVDDMKCAY